MQVQEIIGMFNSGYNEEGVAVVMRGKLATHMHRKVRVVDALEEAPAGYMYACPAQMLYMLTHQESFKNEDWWGSRLLFEGVVFRDVRSEKGYHKWYLGVALWVPSMDFRDGVYAPSRDFRGWSEKEAQNSWKRVCVPIGYPR